MLTIFFQSDSSLTKKKKALVSACMDFLGQMRKHRRVRVQRKVKSAMTAIVQRWQLWSSCAIAIQCYKNLCKRYLLWTGTKTGLSTIEDRDWVFQSQITGSIVFSKTRKKLTCLSESRKTHRTKGATPCNNLKLVFLECCKCCPNAVDLYIINST